MFYRSLGSIEEKISLLGFGCMRFPRLYEDRQDIDEPKALSMIDKAFKSGVNYFDTANPYHGGMSESFMGKALSAYPRDSFKLATKMPLWKLKTVADAPLIFEEQLEKCKVDYFDFYLFHAVNKSSFEKVEALGLYEFLAKMKSEGRIKYLGFSFHDSPAVLKEVVAAHRWDFAQLQINYLDWELQNARTQYQILKEKGIPVIVMEPVRGGELARLTKDAAALLKQYAPEKSLASWAMRYAASLPEVLCVLSGMSSMEQVQDNIKTLTDFSPLSPEENSVLQKACTIYKSAKTIPCTACRYCMDCPFGVDIPQVFDVYNQFCKSGDKMEFVQLYQGLDQKKQAHNCKNCKVCIEKCPQGIHIPRELSKINNLYTY